MRPLTSADLDRPWRLDFHQPRGVVPLGLTVIEDIAAGSRTAAAALGVDGGLVARLVGCHVYLGPAADGIPAGGHRSERGSHPLIPGGNPAAYAVRFGELWAELCGQLRDELAALDALPLAELDARGLTRAWRQARGVCSRAWRLHFAVMYPVFAVHEAVLAGLAAEGVGALEASELIGVPDHTIARTDRALAALADLAAAEGLASIFLHSPSGQLLHRLQSEPRAAQWLARFAEFDTAYGQRSAAVGDLDSPSWHESPSIPLGLVRAALVAGPSAPRPTRPAGVATSLGTRLDAEAVARVKQWLTLAGQAPAAWWNEEHNVLIDLRAHLPLRAVALAAGRLLELPAADDALYLHESELLDLLAGRADATALLTPIQQRRAFVEAWRERRHDLPGHLGAPGNGGDIVLRQILGTPEARPATDGHVDAIGPRPGQPPQSRLPDLEGMGVSSGVARGRARVLASAADIGQLQRGEVLVCEATSPSWTPAFDRIAAAVCDAGGMLTHAAIVSREYGLPCVCAVLDATALIHTGDLLLVDGDLGVVRVLERGMP